VIEIRARNVMCSMDSSRKDYCAILFSPIVVFHPRVLGDQSSTVNGYYCLYQFLIENLN
jgi:hypothetical protein